MNCKLAAVLLSSLLAQCASQGLGLGVEDMGFGIEVANGYDCPAGTQLYFDSFEDGDDGWNARTSGSSLKSGSYLGKFAAGDAYPSKTYAVSPSLDFVRVQFDFLELDSWDGTSAQYGTDTFQFSINGEEMDLGAFAAWIDEGDMNGESPNGIKWEMKSKTGITDIGGTRSEYKDQVHTITAFVPSSLYQDGAITLTFKPNPSQTSNDESAGFDNVAIFSCGTVELNSCESKSELFFDTFDSGNDGWSNPKLYRTSSTGQFLGRYSTGDRAPSKTYAVDATWDMLLLEFDLILMDSWDNNQQWGYDTFQVDINGDILNIGTFDGGDRFRTGRTSSGAKWFMNSKVTPRKMGGNSKYSDEIQSITAYLPRAMYTSGSVTIQFLVGVSQGVEDESAGFDNVKLSAYDGCSIQLVSPAACRSQMTVSVDNFNDGDEDWEDAKLYSLPMTGQFLGRFAKNDASPHKTFKVANSPFLRIEFDFLELDSWDALSAVHGHDILKVEINGDMVNLGDYGSSRDEGTRTGMSPGGIEWTSRSKGRPFRIEGSNSKYSDQMHKISMLVPADIYPSGELEMRFHVYLNSDTDDEAAGFDNIEVTALYKCDGAPTQAPASLGPNKLLTMVGDCSSSSPCGPCQGECVIDSDCAAGETCFSRVGFEEVPGCDGFGERRVNYCTGETLA